MSAQRTSPWLDSKAIGAILLIVGTSIGAGMLALPVANAPSGFWYSSLFLFGSWLIMTYGALCILEVNLWLPKGSSLVSMADKTLGFVGKCVAWFTCLFLFYTLLASYISGGADIFQNLFHLAGISIHQKIASVFVTLLLGGIVYKGIKVVDYANRGLMTAKIIIYLLLAALIAPHIEFHHWSGGQFNKIKDSMMVIITSYGFASIIPSLRIYLEEDPEKLRKVVLVGSLFPLVVYWIWDAVIMGVIPRDTTNGLLSILESNHHQITGLATSLASLLQKPFLTDCFRFFISICMLTAFLGVGITLYDFIADGLQLKRDGGSGIAIALLTFLPPLVVVLILDNAFIMALAYAGIFAVILLLVLPLMMVWSGRYHLKISNGYRVKGGRISLVLALIASISILLFGLFDLIH